MTKRIFYIFIAVFAFAGCASKNPLNTNPASTYDVRYVVRVSGPIDMTIRYLGVNKKVKFVNWNDVKNLFNETPAAIWTKTILAFNGQKIGIENFINGEIDFNSNTNIKAAVFVNDVLIFEVEHKHKVGIEFFIYDGIARN